MFSPAVQMILIGLGTVAGIAAYVFGSMRGKGTPAAAPQTVVAPSGVAFNVGILQDAIDSIRQTARDNEERDRLVRAVASNITRLVELTESHVRLTRELVEVQVRLEKRYQEDLQNRRDNDRDRVGH